MTSLTISHLLMPAIQKLFGSDYFSFKNVYDLVTNYILHQQFHYPYRYLDKHEDKPPFTPTRFNNLLIDCLVVTRKSDRIHSKTVSNIMCTIGFRADVNTIEIKVSSSSCKIVFNMRIVSNSTVVCTTI